MATGRRLQCARLLPGLGRTRPPWRALAGAAEKAGSVPRCPEDQKTLDNFDFNFNKQEAKWVYNAGVFEVTKEIRGEMKLRLSVLLVLLGLWAMPSFGQGCAMCYSTAAAASKDGQRAINRAILVLLVPPLGFMTAGVGLAFRYGKKRDREQPTD